MLTHRKCLRREMEGRVAVGVGVDMIDYVLSSGR